DYYCNSFAGHKRLF
nr:immunoglobulin light chain junction region [Macaca mulatta]MOV94370.1 immunoglobulin light chain junction region [Macaca mulatta]MOV94402.1 immunoglobulin light chain junction region [Macaca mulatta]MOV94418.1 immunoglobulin light chain junction region [Macaca mulatta]MOV94494.1 immunoglobulin light chain junction region [Macaca mulatta]